MWKAKSELVRSFASKKRLAAERDIGALGAKFEMPFWKRLIKLVKKPAEDFANQTHQEIFFGPFRVEPISLSPVTAESGSYVIDPDSEITVLHLQDEFFGAQDLRYELGQAALAMDLYPERFANSLVLGVTYKEVAKLAIRTGFKELEILDCDPEYEHGVRISHKIFQALNNKKGEFALRAVYLPQQEFIERFAPFALEEPSLSNAS